MHAPLHPRKLISIGQRPAQNDNYIGAFVLRFTPDRHYIFHRLSKPVTVLYRRDLHDHDFITLWQKHDRDTLTATLDAVRARRTSVHLKAHSHSLMGRPASCLFSFHPLRHSHGACDYVFGKIGGIAPNAHKTITGHSLKK